MNTSIERTIQRIKRFGLNCTLNDNGHVRHFHCGHEYVEIGGIKWATCNVGAEEPTDSGLYFAWGETKGFTVGQVKNDEKRFKRENYKYGTYDYLTKYNSSNKKTTLESQDDAAIVNMGIGWRMPTRNEFKALFASSTSEWVTNYKGSGVNGRLFTDKTDSFKRLFFPSAGFCADDRVNSVGDYGFYWSSSLYSDSVDLAWLLYFNGGDTYLDNCCSRYYGFAIRGVVAE